MIDFDWGFIFANFYGNSCTKTENLIEDAFLLQFSTLAPKMTIVRAQRIRNESLMIFFNHSISSECFLFTNLATSLVPPALFLLSGNRWHPSISMCPILIPASFQILITLSSRLSSKIS